MKTKYEKMKTEKEQRSEIMRQLRLKFPDEFFASVFSAKDKSCKISHRDEDELTLRREEAKDAKQGKTSLLRAAFA